MAKENKIHMPGVFGGLMRYDDEFESKFMLSPVAVIAFIVAIILFVLVLKIFFSSILPETVGSGVGGFILRLLGI